MEKTSGSWPTELSASAGDRQEHRHPTYDGTRHGEEVKDVTGGGTPNPLLEVRSTVRPKPEGC